MKPKQFWALLIVMILFSCLFVWSQSSKGAAKTQWEYKVMYGNQNENALNQLGLQGWELAEFDAGQAGQQSVYFFKRPK
jgi:hypothetical protein